MVVGTPWAKNLPGFGAGVVGGLCPRSGFGKVGGRGFVAAIAASLPLGTPVVVEKGSGLVNGRASLPSRASKVVAGAPSRQADSLWLWCGPEDAAPLWRPLPRGSRCRFEALEAGGGNRLDRSDPAWLGE